MGRRLWVALALAAAVLWGAWLRLDRTLNDPRFDVREPAGMLRSDPALLYHLTARIRDALGTGRLPPDFRADPDLQHPERTDVPAEFTVGQEFLVAAAARLDPGTPLIVTAARVMALVAALFPLGLFLFARAGTGRAAFGLLAVLLALLTPASYRTIGFVLVREDLSLPLWLLHLGLLARALRSGRARDHALAGLVLAGALATWHAMGFVVALELGCLWLAALARGRAPAPAGAWQLVAPVLAALAVPALRTAGAITSPAAVLAAGLFAPLPWSRLGPARRQGPRAARLALALGSALWFALTRPLAPTAYLHVRDVLLAKLRFLGRLPGDPNAMSFDARLLWQGPFATLGPGDLVAWLGLPAALLAVLALAVLLRARRLPEVDEPQARTGAALERLALGLLALSLPAAWAFERLVVLPGALLPLVIALALARLWGQAPGRGRSLALVAAAGLVLAQASSFAAFVAGQRVTWYLAPDARHELTRTLAAVEREVPAGQAVLCDFVNSTAVLAFAGRPIVLQPKYETDRSRRMAEAFLETLFHGSLEDFSRLVTERFRCRFVLLDRHVLWDLSRYTAGLPLARREPLPGTAAEVLLGRVAARAVPGFELLYASDPPTAEADFRLYRAR